MRPGQKNRMRGGRGNNNNNNRRGPNPLTRSYESNGPDVKVRGTPQHIAEKYVQLARDAHSASDTVMAESYLQHAEHYYRIIAAAQHAQQVSYNQANGLPPPDSDVTDDEDEFEVAGADRFTFRTPQSFQQQNGGYVQPNGQPYDGNEQPAVEGQPTESQPTENRGQPYQQQRGDRNFNNRRFDRGDRNTNDRPDRQEGGRGEFPRQDNPGPDTQIEGQADGRPDRGDRGPRRFGRDRPFGNRPPFGDRGGFQPRPEGGQAADAGADEQPILPSFITAPVRPIVTEEASPQPEIVSPAETDPRVRVRRRRAPRDVAGAVASEGSTEE